MEESNKTMTVFYRVENQKDIHAICTGKQDLRYFGGLEKEDAEKIYGFFYIPLDRFILKNKKYFEIKKDEDDNLYVEMIEEYKQMLKQYL